MVAAKMFSDAALDVGTSASSEALILLMLRLKWCSTRDLHGGSEGGKRNKP
jgi:hypothetical protein